MKLRDFKRRTLKWSNDLELTFAHNGKIYSIVEFCGFREVNKGCEGVNRDTICFIAEPDGQD